MEKRVFADRAEYLGDPDYFDVDIEALITNDYIARRAEEVDPDNISALEGVGPGLESPNTTHYSIIDPWGNNFEILVPGDINASFDIISFGEDGEQGGDEANADITQ